MDPTTRTGQTIQTNPTNPTVWKARPSRRTRLGRRSF